MNARYIVAAIIVFLVGLSFFASKSPYSPFAKSDPLICLYRSDQLGEKEQIAALYAELKNVDISKKMVVENPVGDVKNAKVKIFFDQGKFDSLSQLDNAFLNIAIGLKNSFETNENEKIVGVFDHDKILNLIEFVQKLMPHSKDFLVIYDKNHKDNENNLKKLRDILALKGIQIHECALDKKLNVASQLKDLSQTIAAVILLPSELLLQEAELILEHFKGAKIPVFANHVGLIRSGAFAGFGYDVQDMSYAVAQLISEYLESEEQEINDDLLAEIMPQLHVNMDVLKHIGLNVEDGLLDEAVTVGSEDL